MTSDVRPTRDPEYRRHSGADGKPSGFPKAVTGYSRKLDKSGESGVTRKAGARVVPSGRCAAGLADLVVLQDFEVFLVVDVFAFVLVIFFVDDL